MNSVSVPEAWRATLIPINSNIKDALHSLESSSMQIVLVVAKDDKLLGTLTDGDIRRAFLNGCSMESGVGEILHTKPLVVTPEIDRASVLGLMKANKIHQLPVVNSDGVVVGLELWDAITSPVLLNNPMVIMAGGRGTRLHPQTENCPKPMLKVGGKPILEHIIERARTEGFQKFIISLHYLGNVIEDYFGDGSSFDVSIEYSRETSPLGTAGSLAEMEPLLTSPFIVTNGDVLTNVRYADILNYHLASKAAATMAVRQHEIQNQFGVVKTQGVEIEAFEEKPIYRSHINAGIYVLNPESIRQLKLHEHCDMPLLFQRIKKNLGQTIVFPMHEPWLDVGRQGDLALAQKTFNSE